MFCHFLICAGLKKRYVYGQASGNLAIIGMKGFFTQEDRP